AGHVTVTKLDGDTSSAYFVKLSSPAAGVHSIVAAGGFSIDFGTSLGGLVGLQTTGSIIPLASLLASATFGINLSPSQTLSVGPATFQNGPRADIYTLQEGGKAISVEQIRPGSVPNNVGNVQLL